MKKFFKKLFCKHTGSEVICWHWTHDYDGRKMLEIESRCNDCGKYYFSIIRNRVECEKFISKYKDKEWSATCKPIL